MEGKDRWEQKGRIFLSFSIFFTLLSTTSRLPFRLLSLPTIYHPTLVHRQHGIPCSLWTSNTRLASPIPTEDTSGMVRSETDNDKGTAPPKPVRKIWTTGSISATDKDFLEWLGRQPSTFRARGTVYGMNLYVNHLNVECQMVYERQLKEYKERLHSSEPVDAVPANEPCETNVPEGIVHE